MNAHFSNEELLSNINAAGQKTDYTVVIVVSLLSVVVIAEMIYHYQQKNDRLNRINVKLKTHIEKVQSVQVKKHD